MPIRKRKQSVSEKRLLTTSEAAEMLHITSHTLRHWSDKGILKYLRTNSRGHRRYRLRDIEALLDALKLWKLCLTP